MAQTPIFLAFEPGLKHLYYFRAMAQTLIFWGFEPWLKPTFDMQILTLLSFIFQNVPLPEEILCCLRNIYKVKKLTPCFTIAIPLF